MPLYSANQGMKLVERVPFPEFYYPCIQRLTDDEHDAIRAELNGLADNREILTSSWIPGADWTGTVYDPIYSRACGRSEEAAAKLYGLILWDVMMQRREAWASDHYELNGVPIKGRTYFRVPGLDPV